MGLSSSDTYQSCNEIEHIAEDEVVEDCDIEIPNLRYGVAVGDYDCVDEELDYTRVDEELDYNIVQGVASSPPKWILPECILLRKFGRDLAYPRIRGTDSIINLARILVVQIYLNQNGARWLVCQNVMSNQPFRSCLGDKLFSLISN